MTLMILCYAYKWRIALQKKKKLFSFFRFLCHFMQKHSMFDIRPSEHRLIYVNGITNKRKNHSNFKMFSLLFVLFRNCENGNGFVFNSLLLAQTSMRLFGSTIFQSLKISIQNETTNSMDIVYFYLYCDSINSFFFCCLCPTLSFADMNIQRAMI